MSHFISWTKTQENSCFFYYGTLSFSSNTFESFTEYSRVQSPPTVSPSTRLMGLLKSLLARRWQTADICSLTQFGKELQVKFWKYKNKGRRLSNSIRLSVRLLDTAIDAVELILKQLCCFLKTGSLDRDVTVQQLNCIKTYWKPATAVWSTRDWRSSWFCLCWCMLVRLRSLHCFSYSDAAYLSEPLTFTKLSV